jgi:hypothetical protein
MSLQAIYNEAESKIWADPNAAECGCGGRGWFLSDVDTWHSCPYHKGPHPDEEMPEEPIELTWNERMILRSLYTAKALPGTACGGCFTWNLADPVSNLGRLGLIEWREVPRHDGEMVAQLTERGVKSYLKGVRLGVQSHQNAK